MMEQTKEKKKKKLTLNKIGLAVLAALIIANIFIWKNKAAGEAEVVALSNNISMTQLQISKINEPAADLDARLAAAKAELSALREGFPSTVARNDVVDYILEVAGKCNVGVLPLVSEGWSVVDIGDNYNLLSLSVTAEGSLSNVKALINALQEGRYATLLIPDISIDRIDDGSINAGEGQIQVTASLKICIYTLSPAAEGGSV